MSRIVLSKEHAERYFEVSPYGDRIRAATERRIERLGADSFAITDPSGSVLLWRPMTLAAVKDFGAAVGMAYGSIESDWRRRSERIDRAWESRA